MLTGFLVEAPVNSSEVRLEFAFSEYPAGRSTAVGEKRCLVSECSSRIKTSLFKFGSFIRRFASRFNGLRNSKIACFGGSCLN